MMIVIGREIFNFWWKGFSWVQRSKVGVLKKLNLVKMDLKIVPPGRKWFINAFMDVMGYENALYQPKMTQKK